MSANAAPIVAITGANGYTSLHTIDIFLKAGWKVRGSVRTQAKVEFIRAHPLFKQYSSDQLQLLVIPTLSSRTAIDNLLDGVTGFVHIATPFGMGSLSREEYLEGGKKDIINVIEAANQQPTIKAVSVCTSAMAALKAVPYWEQTDDVYDDDSEAPTTEEDVKKGLADPKSSFYQIYGYTKLVTEKLGKDLARQLNAKFALSFIRPSVILGPTYDIPSPDQTEGASFSSNGLLELISGKDKELRPRVAVDFIDVRDAAQAFFVAITQQKSGRFMVSSGRFDTAILSDTARAVRPDLVELIPAGKPDLAKGAYKIVSTKATRELGIEYRKIDETIKDTLDYFDQIGLIKA